MNDKPKQIRVIATDELPVYDGTNLPAESYFLLVAKTYIPKLNDNLEVGYRFKASDLGKINVDAVVTTNPLQIVLAGGGYTDNVPTHQVVPARMNGVTIAKANSSKADNQAQFLIVSKASASDYLVQSTGVLTFKDGHDYIVGKDYYLGLDGTPTTQQVGDYPQKLFTALSTKDIMINLQTLPEPKKDTGSTEETGGEKNE